jgi:hypothetical protein
VQIRIQEVREHSHLLKKAGQVTILFRMIKEMHLHGSVECLGWKVVRPLSTLPWRMRAPRPGSPAGCEDTWR